MSILAQRYAVRRQGLATGKTMLGKAIFHTVSRPVDREFNIYALRMREIETIITSRHGSIIPNPEGTDDVENCLDYARAIAASLSGQDLHMWARRWMPWAPAAVIGGIARSVGWRKYMLSADQTAKLLGVTLAERNSLGLKTIGACDVDAETRKSAARDAKRARDRERQKKARAATGRVDRETYEKSSLSATRPWEAENISRRTWERRQAAVASLSRVVVDNTIGDTLASRTGDPALAPDGAPPPTGKTLIEASGASPPKAEPALRAGASSAGSGPHRSSEAA